MNGSVAQRIRELIVDGTLAPGTRLAEAALAERLGVSRTPIRNALPALAGEGLLRPAGKRGYAVRGFSIEDSVRATEVRCLLEGQAAREVAARIDRATIVEELRLCLNEGDAIFGKGFLAAGDENQYAEINRRFHDVIVVGAQNRLLAELVQRVYAVPFVAPGVVAFNRIPRAEIFAILMAGHHQHHAIVDAIDAGQSMVAENLLRGHSTLARRSLGLERVSAEDTPHDRDRRSSQRAGQHL